jgi:2-polyprenyl-6-methoxyphenol hydroxylase-like FAD-dependent oxidoreductase
VRIVCVGAGPAGLYFTILAKLKNPAHEVTVIERDSPKSAHGWSLTLGADIFEKLQAGDPESARAIERDTYLWREEYVSIRGQRIVHEGDFDIANLERSRLVEILADRARELGAQVRYDEEVSNVSQLADADLIVAADGVNSRLRHQIGAFGTKIAATRDKYIWLGTDRPFGAFEFFFVETACGWIWAAGYGTQSDQSTFLVHCMPQTWSGLGFGTMPVADSIDVVRELFKEPLAGYRLMGQADNSDRWVSFRTVTNQRWHAGNVVLIGDSAHTTHFTTGLGTVMAIEDAMALADAVDRHDDLGLALEAYERQRKAELKPAQDAARLSSEWFTNIARYINLEPQAFATALYARRSPLLTLVPPWFYCQLHRAFSEVPMMRRFTTRLYPAARSIGR